MNRAIINFEHKTLDTIHEYSLELLRSTGIKFPSEKALGIFKKHGFRTDGDMVFFEEEDIHKTMEAVPSAFTIKARNEAKSIRVGDNNFVMAPGYGPPFIIEPTGEKRNAVLRDVQNFFVLTAYRIHGSGILEWWNIGFRISGLSGLGDKYNEQSDYQLRA